MKLRAFTQQEITLHAQRLFIAYNAWLLNEVVKQRETDINNMYDRNIPHYVIDETGVLINNYVSVDNLAMQIIERKEALKQYIVRCKVLKHATLRLIATYSEQEQQSITRYLITCGKSKETPIVTDFLQKSIERKENDYIQKIKQEADKYRDKRKQHKSLLRAVD
ncbi:hypothetical protein MUA31_09950 [Staphylococcus simulans]|uniref:hypothetical protein n=1 Tax=Staphylococcus simulans TaxID=1286 RepID=UPI0021D30EFE|nr:hypothetical protein [Staphylococcus simulans]UXR34702.1 hypothetical protein MUA31_09950 [Staphylococcus simulans]